MIWFNQQEQSKVQSYLNSDAKDFVPALEEATALIEGLNHLLEWNCFLR
jgi:hypothetical protein